VAHAAAALFAAAAHTAVAERGRFLVALSGGSTPQTLFALLAQPPYQTAIPWSRTQFYWGDERLVPPDDPGSNYYHARTLLLDHVPVPANQVHRIPGELPALEAASAYASLLQRHAEPEHSWPAFDLALLGLGADGHTASLFPGSPPTADPVISVSADYDGRPAGRISLTPPVFNSAHQVAFLVCGAAKAPALTATLQGPKDPFRWPAQRISGSAPPIWIVDQAAAATL